MVKARWKKLCLWKLCKATISSFLYHFFNYFFLFLHIFSQTHRWLQLQSNDREFKTFHLLSKRTRLFSAYSSSEKDNLADNSAAISFSFLSKSRRRVILHLVSERNFPRRRRTNRAKFCSRWLIAGNTALSVFLPTDTHFPVRSTRPLTFSAYFLVYHSSMERAQPSGSHSSPCSYWPIELVRLNSPVSLLDSLWTSMRWCMHSVRKIDNYVNI